LLRADVSGLSARRAANPLWCSISVENGRVIEISLIADRSAIAALDLKIL